MPAQLGISGDALNVAAAAAAAGARVGLLSVLTDDDLGKAIAARIVELGFSPDLLTFRTGQQGVYLVHCDPDGQREFSYARSGSVGSSLGPDDVDPAVFSAAGAVVAGGIACAISASSRAAVLKAAALAKRFVFDPNFRPRLTSVDATAALLQLAPRTFLVTPSFPGENVGAPGLRHRRRRPRRSSGPRRRERGRDLRRRRASSWEGEGDTWIARSRPRPWWTRPAPAMRSSAP